MIPLYNLLVSLYLGFIIDGVKKMRKLLSVILLGVLAFLLHSCGEVVPIYSKIEKVPEYTLHFADQPIEFIIKLDAPEPVVPTRLELTIECDKSTFNRETLPLMVILEGPDHDLVEYPIEVPIIENGEWLGEMDDNQVDVKIIYEAIDLLELESPAKYSLKVYGNDDKEEQIFGVIKLGVRLYLYDIEREGED
ncbi:MAG: hypothetical protein AB8F95_17125 [Bacteroidia bacterium]